MDINHSLRLYRQVLLNLASSFQSILVIDGLGVLLTETAGGYWSANPRNTSILINNKIFQ